MTVDNITDYESFFIDVVENKASIFAILNSVNNFEAILVNLPNNRHYYISILGDKLEEENEIPEEDIVIINEYINMIGGKEAILNKIYNQYKIYKEFRK